MIVSIWAKSLEIMRARPGLFLIAAALLAATNFQMWAMGVLDGAKAADAGAAALVSYVLIKLVIITAYLIASLRLAGGAEARLLALSGRQLKWLAGLIVFMILALAFRAAVTKGAALLLMPLGAGKMTVLLSGLAVYLLSFMYVQMRLTPALIGVLLGDLNAGLRWSWAAMKGEGAKAIGAVIVVMAPLFAIHLGDNLIWVPEGGIARAALLLFDGFVMAAFIQTSTVAYATIYLKAKERLPSLQNSAKADPAFAAL